MLMNIVVVKRLIPLRAVPDSIACCILRNGDILDASHILMTVCVPLNKQMLN